MGSGLRNRIYRFGFFEADPETGKLQREGMRVKLQDQPFRLLCLLLEHAGQVVTREEVRQSLWPANTYVEFDDSLKNAVKRLRFALGDSADNPVFIETLAKRGYRFLAPVVAREPSSTASVANTAGLEQSLTIPTQVSRAWHWRGRLTATGALLVLAFLVVASYHRLTTGKEQGLARSISLPQPKVIAVLPFSNEGAGLDFDYLRYGIASTLVTDLAHIHSVSVRPFASTQKYGSQSTDPVAAGKELQVTHVLDGGFLLDNKNLRVSMELVDVAKNQIVWGDEVTVSPDDLLALHDRLASSTRRGILPTMQVSDASGDRMPTPKNEEALDLFLHSLTVPLDPGPNVAAIKKLEESVFLDSGYAPAWGELGWRYYIDYHYGNGGEAALAKALHAYKQQSALDPSMPSVSTAIRTEQGDLSGAYAQAADFVRRRPDASLAHYGVSYVLRYAGLLEEAGKECDKALAIDPGFNVFRSCANPFILEGDYTHAQKYIRLDEKSGVAALLRMMIALRSGNQAAALAETDAVSQTGYRMADVARIYLKHGAAADLRHASAEVEARHLQDGEELYRNAEVLSFCQQPDAALGQLREAIERGYCSYPAMERDPLFDPIRQRQQFAELGQTAARCQQNFLNHREQVDAVLAALR